MSPPSERGLALSVLMFEQLMELWPLFVSGIALGLATITAAHAIMCRRDAQAALLWVGLIWLTPIVGACLYALFGINRVRRKATRLREGVAQVSMEPSAPPVVPEKLTEGLQQDSFAHFEQLERMIDTILERPLVPRNRVEPLSHEHPHLDPGSSPILRHGSRPYE